MPLLPDATTAYLNITTFVGSSVIGASHYHGRLKRKNTAIKAPSTLSTKEDWDLLKKSVTEIDVDRVVTAEECVRLNREDEDYNERLGLPRDHGASGRYKPGDRSARFWSAESVRIAAVEVCKAQFPDVKYLIANDYGVASLGLFLIAPEDLMVRANAIWKQWDDAWDKYPLHSVRGEEIVTKLDKAWDALVSAHLAQSAAGTATSLLKIAPTSNPNPSRDRSKYMPRGFA